LAVHIRLRRMGKKKRPFYRIVAAESRRARDGRFLEVLGTYNPIEVPAVVTVREERLSYWLSEGAEPSDTVSSLLTQIGFIDKYRKARTGADVTEVALKTTIKERKKKTRRAKKAAAVKAQAAEAEAAAAVEAASNEKPEA
jgi:small subunit ribosomal protein S16